MKMRCDQKGATIYPYRLKRTFIINFIVSQINLLKEMALLTNQDECLF